MNMQKKSLVWILIMGILVTGMDRGEISEVYSASEPAQTEVMETEEIKDETVDLETEELTDDSDDTEPEEKEETSKDTEENKKKTTPGVKIKKGDQLVETQRYDGAIYEKKGESYFKTRKGKKIRKAFFTYKNQVYHAEKDGVLSKGWRKYSGHYYFFNRKTGKLSMGTKEDYIRIGKYGIASEIGENVQRIKTHIKARHVLDQISSPEQNKSERLYQCYLLLKKLGYRQFRTYQEAAASNPKDWDVIFANDIFVRKAGCCVSDSCALAYLAKECGYKNVKICCDSSHAWTDIEGRLYDALFAEVKSFQENYNAEYHDYRANPAVVKKI